MKHQGDLELAVAMQIRRARVEAAIMEKDDNMDDTLLPNLKIFGKKKSTDAIAPLLLEKKSLVDIPPLSITPWSSPSQRSRVAMQEWAHRQEEAKISSSRYPALQDTEQVPQDVRR